MGIFSVLERLKLISAIVCLGLIASVSTFAATTISVEVDRGDDVGQNFGSLFEVETADGEYVIGAGFSGLYNTYHRNDRHMVHFYVRPTGMSRVLESETLPRPGKLAGTYLFNFDGDVYSTNPEVKTWDESADAWQASPKSARIDTRVGNDLLSFENSQVLLNDTVVLSAPGQGGYSGFYYGQGHLFFYHILRVGDGKYKLHTQDDEGFSKIYACPWKVGDGAVDLTKASVITVPVVGEFPYAYGQLGNQVLSCSNIGGGYVFRDGSWRTVIDGDLKTSYQVYTMLTYYDQLLMGQYPTGELFSFDGETVKHLDNWPPTMEGVSGSSREAQTMAIYGGELYVGVWPWGEVWKYHKDLKEWSLAKRMFTHPELTAETTHPYEKETAALGGVANQWGQRVTSMVPLGNDLLISTSAKWPSQWEEKFDFVGEGRWKEYGAVTRITKPGHVSASVRWTKGSTKLNFVLDGSTMRIEQDGKVISEAPLARPTVLISKDANTLKPIKWRQGAYGVFTGPSLEGRVLHD